MLALDEAGLVAYQGLQMLQAIHRSNEDYALDKCC